MHRIGLFLFEFLKTERDWKFILIRINNRKWFLDEIEKYLIINFVLKYIHFIYIAFNVYFLYANDKLFVAR